MKSPFALKIGPPDDPGPAAALDITAPAHSTARSPSNELVTSVSVITPGVALNSSHHVGYFRRPLGRDTESIREIVDDFIYDACSSPAYQWLVG